MTNGWMRAGIVTASVALAACGTESGGGDDVPGDAPRPDAPATTKRGNIVVQQASIFGTPVTIAVAGFNDGPATGTSDRVDGPCVITTGAAISAPAVSAGTVTIMDGVNVISMTPDAMNRYSASQQGLVFAGGASLAFAATGAAVPAFAQALTFPTAITVSAPAPLAAVSKSGFSSTWSGSGPVVVMLSQDDVRIRCRFDGVTSATLPASTLRDLVANTSSEVTIVIAGETQASLTAGGFGIEFSLLNTGLMTEGMVQ